MICVHLRRGPQGNYLDITTHRYFLPPSQELEMLFPVQQRTELSLLSLITPTCPRPKCNAHDFPSQKLSPSPQQTQGSSVPSPHPTQPSQEESSPCSDMSSYEEPPSPLSAASSGPLAPAPPAAPVPTHRQPSRLSDQEGCTRREAPTLCQPVLPNDPTKWNVEEVYEFICSLPGQWTHTHTHV